LSVSIKREIKLISEKIINASVRALCNIIFLLSDIQLTCEKYTKTREEKKEDISSHNILYLRSITTHSFLLLDSKIFTNQEAKRKSRLWKLVSVVVYEMDFRV
jgi:hypothetical protein